MNRKMSSANVATKKSWRSMIRRWTRKISQRTGRLYDVRNKTQALTTYFTNQKKSPRSGLITLSANPPNLTHGNFLLLGTETLRLPKQGHPTRSYPLQSFR